MAGVGVSEVPSCGGDVAPSHGGWGEAPLLGTDVNAIRSGRGLAIQILEAKNQGGTRRGGGLEVRGGWFRG